ncbi:hypothetical protein GGS26DRAFT_573655 [Hypomontagnella submonticulosa]|nr:hypothetical protein GGS26DRAFT_573655 [Hypomontagnella submonticulosa]
MAQNLMPTRHYGVRTDSYTLVFDNSEDFEKHILWYPNAVFKILNTYEDENEFLGDDPDPDESEVEEGAEDLVWEDSSTSSRGSPDTAVVKVENTAALMPPLPPPASQSYFDGFNNFVPDNKSRFDDEFHRFASSQGIVPGSKDYRRQRTRAIRDELVFHYSPRSNRVIRNLFATPKPGNDLLDEGQAIDADEAQEATPELTQTVLDEEMQLEIYQNMCHAVGIPQELTISECKRVLRGLLVNIIDYIDARRTGKEIKVWDWSEFGEFSAYTLQDGKRIDKDEAKAGGGFLSVFLQELAGPRRRKRRRRNRKRTCQGEAGVSKRVRV